MAWMVYDYPEPPPEPPMPCCARCQEYLTEVYYITDTGAEVCEECLEEEKNETTLDEFAELKGYYKRYLE